MPPEPEQSSALEDPRHVESSAIAQVDWEHGKRALRLPLDQTQAVEAKIEGLNLQSSDAPGYLGWDPSRLEAVRRSLEADRPWGRTFGTGLWPMILKGKTLRKDRNICPEISLCVPELLRTTA
jgi:hypothetical protein